MTDSRPVSDRSATEARLWAALRRIDVIVQEGGTLDNVAAVTRPLFAPSDETRCAHELWDHEAEACLDCGAAPPVASDQIQPDTEDR